MPLQRMIQREPARQVVVIEVGAVDAVHDVLVSEAAERDCGKLLGAPRYKLFL